MGLRNKQNCYAVLLAGGQGSRFWPLSRVLEPKQLIALFDAKSLFEQTILRINKLIHPYRIYVVTSQLYKFQIFEICSRYNIPKANIIFEPSGKNTAVSIALASRIINLKDPASRLCVLPCDHKIVNNRSFSKMISFALDECGRQIMILGVAPTRPATGYGYIKAGLRARKNSFKVSKFCEKPDYRTAKVFIKNRKYFWNSGIFIAASNVFLGEFKKFMPQLYKQINEITGSPHLTDVWGRIKPASFDYGILEKTDNLVMLKAVGLGWSDLGSWQAWDELSEKDKDGNLFRGDVINLDSKNITAIGSNRLLAAIGLRDLIVVDTPDAILITKKDRSEDVKLVVDRLKNDSRKEHYEHITVRRPWGCYSVLESGRGFKVKLVTVNPGCSLSLQYHRKRSEHWVVVEGRARIVKDKNTVDLHKNESTYVPLGCRHRLINPGTNYLKIIEVQTGGDISESDIVRLSDNFGRV